jgi:protoheme IX farnesyltransferase
MLPNVAGPSATCQQILIHSLLLVPASFGPLLIQGVGLSYAAAAALVDAALVWRALALFRLRDGDESPRRKAAMALFGYSILYMFLVFAALLAQAIVR